MSQISPLLCVVMQSVIMLSVVMLSVVMLMVVMLRVIMLSVVAPQFAPMDGACPSGAQEGNTSGLYYKHILTIVSDDRK